MRLDSKKDIQFVKFSLVNLYSELKTSVLPPLEGNNNKCKTQNGIVRDPAYQLNSSSKELLKSDSHFPKKLFYLHQ